MCSFRSVRKRQLILGLLALASILGVSVPALAVGVITVTSPMNGATVTVPFDVHFTYSSTDTYTKLWIDGVPIISEHNGSTFDYTVTSLATGKHVLALQAHDASSNTTVTDDITITVSSGPPTITVSVTPTSVTLPPNGIQQFTATVQNTSDTAVDWSVDSILNGDSSVGTISGSGTTVTYMAPATAGKHSVTATSVADSNDFASATVTVASATSFPSSNHVFVIMEENQDFSQVFPNGTASNCSGSGMPYLCGLASANGLALHFYSNVHGSLLDYLWDTSGADWTGTPYDCGGSSCASEGIITGDNLVRALTNEGKTWRGYFEGMPSQGYMGGDTDDYVQHHNPFIWYSDVADSSTQQDNMYPFSQFAKDVQANSFHNFSYIVPNVVHDADGTGTQSASALLSSADSWLKTNIAPLLSTPSFGAGGDGILIVVFDEGKVAGKSGDTSSDDSCSPTQTSGCGGRIAFVMIGPKVMPGSTTSNTYHFQDMLHTIIHLLGMSDYMNSASGAADITLLPGAN
jgi:acid phosphatase